MGTGGSFLRHNDEDDVLGVEYDSSQGVVKRIPIEVKPRGRLGLRSVRSLGKSKGSSSLRSAISVDLENPETEKICKDFEMYRLNKENEIANMQKKVKRLETENRRLRAELQTLQMTGRKLREERDMAQEAEHQAFVRATSFEMDRDKIQRHFKVWGPISSPALCHYNGKWYRKGKTLIPGIHINLNKHEVKGQKRQMHIL